MSISVGVMVFETEQMFKDQVSHIWIQANPVLYLLDTSIINAFGVTTGVIY